MLRFIYKENSNFYKKFNKVSSLNRTLETIHQVTITTPQQQYHMLERFLTHYFTRSLEKLARSRQICIPFSTCKQVYLHCIIFTQPTPSRNKPTKLYISIHNSHDPLNINTSQTLHKRRANDHKSTITKKKLGAYKPPSHEQAPIQEFMQLNTREPYLYT